MPVFVAMLRGINVSGQKTVKMDRLRASFESLGFCGVKTYLQSGNVVFKAANASAAGLAEKIARKILDDFGFPVTVLVRTPEELGRGLRTNPLLNRPGVDEAKLHVTFLSVPAPQRAEELLIPLTADVERFAVCGQEIYLYCPAGYGRTRLSNRAIEKKLSVQATTRNWKTVNALFEMANP